MWGVLVSWIYYGIMIYIDIIIRLIFKDMSRGGGV